MKPNSLFTGYFAACILFLSSMQSCKPSTAAEPNAADSTGGGVAILLVDADHPVSEIKEGIYGQFLEHINHSVIEGLYAEQIRGQGFEGEDFKRYWKTGSGKVELAAFPFEKGTNSLRLTASGEPAVVKQDSLYVQKGMDYSGSVWLKPENGRPTLALNIKDASGKELNTLALNYADTGWQEIPFSFLPNQTDSLAVFEISASGSGSVLIDFISLMRTDVRKTGKLRPDLLQALADLKPSFIRWPGGSFASTYKWQDGIGSPVTRGYHPNVMWGGYADYYGFGTDEFLEMCRQLNTEPMIVLPAPSTKPEDLAYAMNWVHYLVDPATTTWGMVRAANGHPEPYDIPYFQVDNEPMNNGFTANEYAEIANVYGSELRKIVPNAKIVACGQKRSNDLNWSQTVIDFAGKNFDILGCHNYEYEPENFQTGVQRIENYLVNLQHYIQNSAHPKIEIAVLEWSSARTYDWSAGLHAAGSLISYEKLSPQLSMSCPALLMRNTTDNPEWRAFIYHNRVSWFPGSGYLVEKLFRDHFAPTMLASTSGTFKDLEKRSTFFDDIPQMKPEDWTPGTIDAIATQSKDKKRIVIKAVNYAATTNTLLVRLQGADIPASATIKTYTLQAGREDMPTMEQPDKIKIEEGTTAFTKDLSFSMEPNTVLVAEIIAP